MEEITIAKVRKVLLDMDVLSEEQSLAMSDEDLLLKDFEYDLGMDSLDFILFLQKLKGVDTLSVIDATFWDCRKIKDLFDCMDKKIRV